MNYFLRFVLAWTILLSPYAQASQTQMPAKVIRITGVISEQTLAKMRLDLMRFQNDDPFPAGLIVLLNSPGGDGEAAMAIGRLLREHQAHVFVVGRCDSACIFLLMGGVVRAAVTGTVGVHAGRLTLMKPDGQVIKEVDASKSLPDSFQLAGYNRDTRMYLQEMGIGHGILDVMLAHPTHQVYQLTLEDISRYGVTGFDNAYLNQRVRVLDALGYGQRINRIQLYNRTMSVPQGCRVAASSDRAFIDCYRRTVLGQR